jgi:uncharacterized ferredoxin-like protein
LTKLHKQQGEKTGSKKMKILYEHDIRENTVLEVAKKMMTAARTAPKARGVDNTVIALLLKDGIREVSDRLKEMVRRDGLSDFFLRDAENILSAEAMLVMGTKIAAMGLSPCGMCGFAGCEEKKAHPEHPCVFNTGDLGIAIGSAVSLAMDNRVDNRVMYTVGQALLEMGVLGKDVRIAYGIPLSVSGKNPFFDRNIEKLTGKK